MLYLQQLAKEPDNLFAAFQEALKVLVSCTCDDGCYNCLYAYRNSFDQDRTGRQTAIALRMTGPLNYNGCGTVPSDTTTSCSFYPIHIY